MARYRSRHHHPFHVQQLTQELLLNDREDSGVQLDEPSSPLSRQMDDESADIVQQLSQPTRPMVGKNSKQTESQTSVLRQSRVAGDDKSVKTKSTSCDSWREVKNQAPGLGWCHSGLSTRLPGNRRHISDLSLDACVSNDANSSRCDKMHVEVALSLDEDEGLDIPDTHSELRKGSNSGNSRQEGDSSECSETETVEFYLKETSVVEETREGTRILENCETHSSTSVTKVKDSKKRRFRRLLTGGEIRRSKSLGCAKDLAVPDHALFLKHSPSDIRKLDDDVADREMPRRPIHKTCSADAAMMSQEMIPCDPGDIVKQKQKSSLAKNMRRKFQKLRRRNTDSFLGQAIMSVRGGTSKVTPTDALEWAQSFDILLGDKNGLELFKSFLKSEFSEENLEFWIACEDFKTIRTNKLVAGAQKIYTDFIAIKAPKQINLDSKTRLETITGLESPTRDTFRQAQKKIQFLMENDSYKRFLESDVYRALLKSPARSGSR